MQHEEIEYKFLCEKLKKIAVLLNNNGLLEAMFIIGSLHEYCFERISDDENSGD